MSRLIVTDSGGVERTIKRLFATDSGSIERDIKRLFVIDSGGVARLVFTSGVVTVSGENVSATINTPTGAQSRITFKADGTVTKTENIIETQVDSLTDWIIPNSSANSGYEIRYTLFSGNGVISSLSEDVWSALDQNHSITLTRVGSNVGTSTCTFTIEIRFSGGPVLDSAIYSLTSTVGP